MTGQQDHWEFGIHAAHCLEQLDPVHSRHTDVTDDWSGEFAT